MHEGYTREELIELIREDYLKAFAASDQALSNFMDTGFKGFDNMGYSELLKDAKANSLIGED